MDNCDYSNDIVKYIDTMPQNNNQDDKKKVIKCLKSYLTAKKYHDVDDDKAFLYFKQCINLLNDIKKNNIELKDDLLNIMDETETECSKFLTKAIETTIEKPYNRPLVKTENLNELYDIINTGNIEKLKLYKYGELDFNIMNDEGLTPLHYAIKFGDTSFIKIALKLGAYIDQTNSIGHTLLEYACLEKDPNMINFITLYGADMKKHLVFRQNKVYNNKGGQLELLLLEKYFMDKQLSYNNIKYLNWVFNYLNKDEFIELEYNNHINANPKIKLFDLILKIDNYIHTLNNTSRDTFISIVKDELEYNLQSKLGCPINKLEIFLYNLVPFINDNNVNYDINELKLDWLISMEIKYLVLKILKNRKKINTYELKNELSDLLNESYIKPNIISEGMIQIIASRWLSKIKV